MNCRYCGTPIAEDDHRCQRCGRRIHDDSARPAPELYPIDRGRALAPHPMTRTGPPPKPEAPNKSAPYQAALFSSREIGRVVPIQAHGNNDRKRSGRKSDGGRMEETGTHQESFSFPSGSSGGRGRGPANEAVRYCNYPVAIPLHRMMAAAADFSMIAIAVGMILTMLHIVARQDLMNVTTLPFLIAPAFVLALMYKLLWAMAGTDSPGLRWAHLRTLNFDGLEPTRAQRLQRVAAGCLSLLAGGLGRAFRGNRDHLPGH